MQLNSIRNCKKNIYIYIYWLQKIENYNLTKQKYFKYIQLYKIKIIIKKKIQTKFYIQLNSIRNCKKKKSIIGCKKSINHAKILRM